MNNHERLRLFALFVLLSSYVVLAQSQGDKIVFLRDDVLMTAKADGSNAKRLVDDGIPKSRLSWAPRGDKIIYDIAGVEKQGSTKSHVKLVVVDAQGHKVNEIPVLAREADGA
ncbi:MAG: hypothetical protein WAN65_27235, partial [Candidatus Sulfotelmatobacter sp.]